MKTKTMVKSKTEDDKMLAKRSEILFLYDARMCNPNGDPEENRPRYDEETGKVYVTEFRLKRTIRKYLNEVMHHKILLRQELDEELEKSEGKASFKMLDKLAKLYIEHVDGGKGKKDKIPKVKREELLNDHIDVKLFGILFAVKGGINFKTVGPVQFAMGQSLNALKGDTDIIRIGMTSLVPNTKDEAGMSKGGSFGEKYIVRYALMQFHGFVNNNAAREVNISEEDVKTMTYAMWNGTDMLSTTSKFGQKSRLMMKVNYRDNGLVGDLDLMTKLERTTKEQTTLENITQVRLNLDGLLGLIDDNKDIIESIEYEFNPVLQCTHNDKHGDFEKLITEWSKQSKIPVSRIDFSDISEDMIEGAGEQRIEASNA